MTFTEQDQKDLLEGFVNWLAEHDWITGADHAKRMYLVAEYQDVIKPKWGDGRQV